MIYILSYILNKHKIYYMLLDINHIINDENNKILIKSIDWVETNLKINKSELDKLLDQSNKYIILDENLDLWQQKMLFKALLTSSININNQENIMNILKVLNKENKDQENKNIMNEYKDYNKDIELLFKPCSARLRWVLIKVFYELNL